MPRIPSMNPKALGPLAMSLLSFILVVILMSIGASLNWQSFALITVDTTVFKDAYSTSTGAGLPIHDAYSLHLQTTCESYLFKKPDVRFVSVMCEEPGTYVKFQPLQFIQNDLTTHRSRQTVYSIGLPYAIQDIFTKKYNLVLHVAFIIYIFTIMFTCIGFLLGGAAVFKVNVLGRTPLIGFGTAAFSFLLLFIASVMTTVIQSNATSTINKLGAPVGVYAFHGSGFTALSWGSCVASLLAAGAWLMVVER